MTFVDSSFWIALRNRRDAHHSEARALLEIHHRDGLVTTNHVVGETWTFLRRRAGHTAACDFLRSVQASPTIGISFVEVHLELEAFEWLLRRGEREYSFVDATSFGFMRAERIDSVLTFDSDFAAAGFVVLSS